MHKEPLKIMGINPGTRYLGIAIFQGSQLRDWNVKVLKGKWTKKKLEKAKSIVFNIIEQYDPDILAVKKLHPSRNSLNLTKLTTKLKELSRRKGIKVFQYTIRELELFFSSEEKINKKEMAQKVASKYPHLLHELKKEEDNKNPYYIRMFEAVALGIACFHEIDRK